MSIVSNNIKYLRRLNGLTQEQFARRIGIKRSLLGAYEEGRANPNLDNLKVIATTFGVSVDNIIKQDIRKLRDTPDLTFGFEEKTTPEPAPIPVVSPISNASSPRSFGDLVNNFMNQSPPTVQTPVHTYRSTGIKLVAQKVTLKPFLQNSHYSTSPMNRQPLSFNNSYERENKQPTDNQSLSTHQIIQLVKKNQFTEYLHRFQDANFIKNLTEFQIPSLPIGEYRAFEATQDFAFEGALLIGSFIRNWFEILDGKNYVLVTKNQGIIYRRVYNQVKIKGVLLLSTENHGINTSEIPIKDVIEAWEVRAFISQKLPEPSISLEKLNNLVDELKFELERLTQ